MMFIKKLFCLLFWHRLEERIWHYTTWNAQRKSCKVCKRCMRFIDVKEKQIDYFCLKHWRHRNPEWCIVCKEQKWFDNVEDIQ